MDIAYSYLVHLYSLSGGHVVGKFSPHEAFAIGGTNSVRGYEEGAVGSGRSYVVGSGEISFPMVIFVSDIPKSLFPNGVNIMILKFYPFCAERTGRGRRFCGLWY